MKKPKKSKKFDKSYILWILIAIVVIAAIGYKVYDYTGESKTDLKDKIVATVDGAEILQSEVDKVYESFPAQIKVEKSKVEALNYSITRLVFIQAAKKAGYASTEEDVLKLVNKTGKTKEEIIQLLEAEGNTWEDLVEQTKDNILVEKYLSDKIADPEISENEAKTFYNDNIAQFSQPASVRASHILVDTEEEAKAILEKHNNGFRFDDLAKDNSKCPSSANGGDLGTFTKGKMVKEFSDAAFALEIGKISEPVKTEFGWHIIKTTEKNSAQTKSFEELKDAIITQLKNQIKTEELKEVSKELMQKAEIKIIVHQRRY